MLSVPPSSVLVGMPYLFYDAFLLVLIRYYRPFIICNSLIVGTTHQL
jgi:hypothetical protein